MASHLFSQPAQIDKPPTLEAPRLAGRQRRRRRQLEVLRTGRWCRPDPRDLYFVGGVAAIAVAGLRDYGVAIARAHGGFAVEIGELVLDLKALLIGDWNLEQRLERAVALRTHD